jgi:hypothetical protein
MERGCWCLLFVVVAVVPAAGQVDQARAEEYFKEAQALCERDGGRLWGVSLCGPMVIADAATGTIATSQPAPAGDRPRVLGYVNAPVQWGGITWSAYNWQMIPQDPGERGRLFMHELFHCIQPRLGLTTGGSADTADHLDSLEGRYWMRLEWRALARALAASGAARTSAIADALAFRAARHQRFPGAAAAEHVADINEGIATYTQYVTGSDSAEEASRHARTTLSGAETGTSFVRTFAYASGAGYGLLLDALSPGWHRTITRASDVGQLLSAAAGVTAAPDAAAEAAARYDGGSLRAAEEKRDREQQVIIAELRRRYVDGPVLVVPRAGSGSVNNTGATVIPGAGTVLRAMSNKSAWGFFHAKDGVMISADGQTVSLPAPVVVDASTLKGDGWTATVGPGWTVQPGPRPGSFRVVRGDAGGGQR